MIIICIVMILEWNEFKNFLFWKLRFCFGGFWYLIYIFCDDVIFVCGKVEKLVGFKIKKNVDFIY